MKEDFPPRKPGYALTAHEDWNPVGQVSGRFAQFVGGSGLAVRHGASTFSMSGFPPWEQFTFEISEIVDEDGLYKGKIVYYLPPEDVWKVDDKEWEIDSRGIEVKLAVEQRVVCHWDQQRGMFVPITVKTKFWAQLLSSRCFAPNRWEYEFIEVELSGREWVPALNGRYGVSRNTVEVPNYCRGMQGNGINLDICNACWEACGTDPGSCQGNPCIGMSSGAGANCIGNAGCCCYLLPIGKGAVVEMYEEALEEGGSGGGANLSAELDFRLSVAYQDDNLTVSQKTAVASAVSRINNTISVGAGDVAVSVQTTSIDGPSGTLAMAGPTAIRRSNKLPVEGRLIIDLADVDVVENAGQLEDLLLHELLHAIGFGSLWSYHPKLVEGLSGSNPQFVGSEAVNQYNLITGGSASGIPLETGGGKGTREAHWKESVFGDELMTGWLNVDANNPLSAVTLGALQDVGYTIDFSQADPFTPGLLSRKRIKRLKRLGKMMPLDVRPVEVDDEWISPHLQAAKDQFGSGGSDDTLNQYWFQEANQYIRCGYVPGSSSSSGSSLSESSLSESLSASSACDYTGDVVVGTALSGGCDVVCLAKTTLTFRDGKLCETGSGDADCVSLCSGYIVNVTYINHTFTFYYEDNSTIIINIDDCCEQCCSGGGGGSGPSYSPSDSLSDSLSNPPSSKSSAIVPASWTEGGYTALFVEEAPEVRFNDVLKVRTRQRDAKFPLDPRYVEVCERETLLVDGCVPNLPVLVGASVVDNSLQLLFAEQKPDVELSIVVRLTGIRRGFTGIRFPSRTREQYEANERFLRSAYPGAGR